PVLTLISLTGLDTTKPVGKALLFVVWMNVFQPSVTDCGFWWRASVLVKPSADVVPASVRIPAKNDVRGCAHARIQLLILLGKIAVQFLQRQGLMFQFLGSLGNASFEAYVQPLELLVFAVELREHLNLGFQHFRNYRDRKIVHGTMLISLQPIEIGE